MKTSKWIDKFKQWMSNPLVYNIIASIIVATVATVMVITLKANAKIDYMEESLDSMIETQKIQGDKIEGIKNDIADMREDISSIQKSIETMAENQRIIEEAINKRFEKIESFLGLE